MTEPVSQPIFFVVDEDPSAVEALGSDLERHFSADYRVMGETSVAAALERLGVLREAGEQVALIICYESMRAMPGSELLARSRSTHPNAKRILLIEKVDQHMLEVIAHGMALGHVEYYLTKPWRPRQHLLYPVVGEALVAWTGSIDRGSRWCGSSATAGIRSPLNCGTRWSATMSRTPSMIVIPPRAPRPSAPRSGRDSARMT
jgi:CheY-like chemotaxis protein